MYIAIFSKESSGFYTFSSSKENSTKIKRLHAGVRVRGMLFNEDVDNYELMLYKEEENILNNIDLLLTMINGHAEIYVRKCKF